MTSTVKVNSTVIANSTVKIKWRGSVFNRYADINTIMGYCHIGKGSIFSMTWRRS